MSERPEIQKIESPAPNQPEQRSNNAWGINQRSAKESSVVKKIRLQEQKKALKAKSNSATPEKISPQTSEETQDKI